VWGSAEACSVLLECRVWILAERGSESSESSSSGPTSTGRRSPRPLRGSARAAEWRNRAAKPEILHSIELLAAAGRIVVGDRVSSGLEVDWLGRVRADRHVSSSIHHVSHHSTNHHVIHVTFIAICMYVLDESDCRTIRQPTSPLHPLP